uniref:Uncharacterized protein n=1 Tax=Knipowitschia caucasica TaxID=637954 RepID=A0AAV2LWK3_KNICA
MVHHAAGVKQSRLVMALERWKCLIGASRDGAVWRRQEKEVVDVSVSEKVTTLSPATTPPPPPPNPPTPQSPPNSNTLLPDEPPLAPLRTAPARGLGLLLLP